MKKAFGLILFAAMLFACVSCQVKSGGLNDKESQQGSTVTMFENEIETTPSQEEKLPSVLFSSYDDVLNTLSKIAKHEGKESFEAGMPKLDSREQEIYQRLCGITSQMLNTPKECTLHCSLLDLDGDGTEEMHAVALLGEGVWNLVPLEKTETFFTIRGGVPSLDDGRLLERYRQMKQNETPSIKTIQDPLVTHPHYRMMRLDFQNEKTEKIEYEIYSSDGALVKTGDARTSFWGYREGDLIKFSADARIFFYSISQNKFSEDNFPGYVEFSTVSQKAAYVRNGILTVQDIFDRNAYYEEFPNYREPYSYYFAEDGKSVSFRHVVEGAKKDATSVICFEELPIIRAIKICYIRTGPGTNYDILMPSSGTYAYLRSATQDTARLLQAEPIIGGSYESDDGTTRNDWYKISYYGREYYVSADSFEVEIYRANEDTPAQNENPDLVPSEAEIAMEMYEAAIRDEICVFDERLGEIKLKDCRFPSNHLRLDECEILNKAILDMDGDGVNEYVIQSEAKDHIVLHYYDGKVYSYCFDSKSFFNLNTDGSFYWIDSYELSNCTRGHNQILFDGSLCHVKEIYRIKQTSPYDYGDGDHEYYMDGKQITREKFRDYYDSNCRGKTMAIFSPLDISCEYPISSEKAFELASVFWGFKSGTEDGAAGSLYVLKIVILEKPNSNTQSYRIGYQWEHYSTHVIDSCYAQPPSSVRIYEELIVDAITGECREYIDTEPDGKG